MYKNKKGKTVFWAICPLTVAFNKALLTCIQTHSKVFPVYFSLDTFFGLKLNQPQWGGQLSKSLNFLILLKINWITITRINSITLYCHLQHLKICLKNHTDIPYWIENMVTMCLRLHPFSNICFREKDLLKMGNTLTLVLSGKFPFNPRIGQSSSMKSSLLYKWNLKYDNT